MGNTLSEIDSALHVGEEIVPLALGALATFDPPAAGLAPVIGGLFQAAVKSVDVASQDQSAGKDLETTIADVIAAWENGMGLTPGTLSTASAPPAAATQSAGT